MGTLLGSDVGFAVGRVDGEIVGLKLYPQHRVDVGVLQLFRAYGTAETPAGQEMLQYPFVHD